MNMRYLGAASALALTVSLGAAGTASAQVSSATLRGAVTDGGQAETGGTVTARDVATGFTSRGRIGAEGGYVIPGLRPGTYEIVVATADGDAATDTVTLALGQVGTLNLDVGQESGNPRFTSIDGEVTQVDDIVVVGRRIFEVRTPEIATNVSQAQINNLPQINRNFLNFAALAPGLRLSQDPQERTISAGGAPAQQINVFIDGQNQKSTIIDGGVAGQDDSRGNPFPQAGVQEFRVITQNFKAEYEQAGSAVITAVTRSGTNEFSGDVFVTYQDQDWIEQTIFDRRNNVPKPPLENLQYGFSVGGPIIEDTLHFFMAYERKDETRSNSVFSNDATYASLFASEFGTFAAPFEQDLLFGKLSWQVNSDHRLELSGTFRDENDIRDFGGGTSYDRAQQVNTDVRSVVLKHQWTGAGFFNEASVDYFQYVYNPTALNFSDYGREFIVFRDDSPAPGFQYNVFNRDRTVFNTGGRSDNQYIEQENLTFKNDLTFTDVQWMGTHTIKLGAKYSMQTMYVNKQFGRNPQFRFDVEARPEINGSRDIPVSVFLGSAVPAADVENNVIGLYIQDDWQITPQLEINLGLRWDYEDNAVNNDYVTPTNIRNMLNAIQALPGYDFPSYFNPADYISDGDREAFKDAWQPRVGFSYDVFDDERTVVFGGAGRYYDRIGFNFAFDERFKPLQFNKEIFFSLTGAPVNGVPTVAWNPSYLTPAGLDPLLAAAPGAGEVFLVKNDAPIPYTDQYNIGLRQKFGDWQAEITLAAGRTKNEFAWYIANAGAETGNRFGGPTPTSVGFPEFRNLIFFSAHERERRYEAVYLKLDKPYNAQDGWGFNFAYTFMDAEQNGSRDNGLAGFDFDYNSPDQTPWYPSSFDERHRIVASGIIDLPADFKLSGIVTLGSGTPFTQFVCPTAVRPDPSNPDICWNAGRPKKYGFIIPDAWAYRQVDLRLTRTFELWDGHAVEAMFDAINVFNYRNYNGFEQCLCSAEYGDPRSQALPTRSFQVGLRYRW